jgi:O-antigen/teichoic acid export membrane protein
MLKKNIISNIFGSFYGSFVQFFLLPIILAKVGPEAYGLVGLYFTILAFFTLFDLGLTPTLFREISKLANVTKKNRKNFFLVNFTNLQKIYFGIVFLLIIFSYFMAPIISIYWLNVNSLPIDVLVNSLRFIMIQSAFQLLNNFYLNGIAALDMVSSNIVTSLNSTLRLFVTLYVLFFYVGNIEFYFLIQLYLTILNTIFSGYILYRKLFLISGKKSLFTFFLINFFSKFDIKVFSKIKEFSIGMMYTTVLVFLITQSDKIILTKLLTLEQFGYYSIAISVPLAISSLANLITRSFQPKMNQLFEVRNIAELDLLYLKACSLIAYAIAFLAIPLMIFSREFLLLFLAGNDEVVKIVPVFTMLVFGYSLHSLTFMPYALSISNGWARYGLNVSIFALLIMTPLNILLTIKFHLLGAALAWLILSIGYLFFSVVYLHKNIHRNLIRKFYACIGLQLTGIFLSFFIALYRFI